MFESTLLEDSTGTCSRDVSGEEIPALPWARGGDLHCKHSTFQSEQEDHYKFQDSLVYILCTINHVSMSKVYGYIGKLCSSLSFRPPYIPAHTWAPQLSTHTITQKLSMFVIYMHMCIGLCNRYVCLTFAHFHTIFLSHVSLNLKVGGQQAPITLLSCPQHKYLAFYGGNGKF